MLAHVFEVFFQLADAPPNIAAVDFEPFKQGQMPKMQAFLDGEKLPLSETARRPTTRFLSPKCR